MTEQEQYEYIMTDMQKKLEWLKKILTIMSLL